MLDQKNKNLICNQNNPRDTYKELFKRFIIPLYLPLLIMISSINLLITKENINYLKYRYSVFLFGILIIVISESSIGFIDNSFKINSFYTIIPIVIFLISYLTLIIKFKKNI